MIGGGGGSPGRRLPRASRALGRSGPGQERLLPSSPGRRLPRASRALGRSGPGQERRLPSSPGRRLPRASRALGRSGPGQERRLPSSPGRRLPRASRALGRSGPGQERRLPSSPGRRLPRASRARNAACRPAPAGGRAAGRNGPGQERRLPSSPGRRLPRASRAAGRSGPGQERRLPSSPGRRLPRASRALRGGAGLVRSAACRPAPAGGCPGPVEPRGGTGLVRSAACRPAPAGGCPGPVEPWGGAGLVRSAACRPAPAEAAPGQSGRGEVREDIESSFDSINLLSTSAGSLTLLEEIDTESMVYLNQHDLATDIRDAMLLGEPSNQDGEVRLEQSSACGPVDVQQSAQIGQSPSSASEPPVLAEGCLRTDEQLAENRQPSTVKHSLRPVPVTCGARKCRQKCTDKITNIQRQNINSRVNRLSWEARRQWFRCYVKKKEVQSKKNLKGLGHAKHRTLVWTLPDDSDRPVTVCKPFFLAAVGLKANNDQAVRNALDPEKQEDGRGSGVPRTKIDAAMIQNHIKEYRPCTVLHTYNLYANCLHNMRLCSFRFY